MGVERSVTRWYLQCQIILNELAQLEAQIVPLSDPASPAALPAETAVALERQQQVKRTQEKLKTLGPCPKPMMG